MKAKIIAATPENVADFGMCGYKNPKNEGYAKKIEFVRSRLSKGLVYKFLVSESGEPVGGIEYMPGEIAWRAVECPGYMFLQCIYIMKKPFKGQGYGRAMLEECIDDAKRLGMRGVATVASKGTWAPTRDLFAEKGFELVDKANPNFELLVLNFDGAEDALAPKFKSGLKEKINAVEGLRIFVSDQCPYLDKAAKEIPEKAAEFGLEPEIVFLDKSLDAQNAPCAFGSFAVVWDGELVADRPISKTRFANIAKKKLSPKKKT